MLDKYHRLNIGEKFQCSLCDYATSDIDKIQNHLLYHVLNDVPEKDCTRTQVPYDRRSQQNSNICTPSNNCASLNLPHFDSNEIPNFDKPEKGRNKYQITDNKSKYPSIGENRAYNRLHGGQFAPNTTRPPRSGHDGHCASARIATNREDQRIFQSTGRHNVGQKAIIPRSQERNQRDSDFSFARRNADSPKKHQGSHRGTNDSDEKHSSLSSRPRKHVNGYPSSYAPIPINYRETYSSSEFCLKMRTRGRPSSSDYHVVMERKADVSSERSVSDESRCGSYCRQGRAEYRRGNRGDPDGCSWHDRHRMPHNTENRGKNVRPDSCGSSIRHGDRHSRYDKREREVSLHKHSSPGRRERQSTSNRRVSTGTNSSIERRGGWSNSDGRSSLYLRGRHISRRDIPNDSDGHHSPNRQSNPDRRNRRGYSDRRVNPDRNRSLERRGSSDRHGSLYLRGRCINTDRRERPSGSDGRDSPNRQSNTDRRNGRGNSNRRVNPDINRSLERRCGSDRRGSLQFSGRHNHTDRRESHGNSDVHDSLQKHRNHERRNRLGNSHRRVNPERDSGLERRGSCGSSDRRGSLHLRGRHMSTDTRERPSGSDGCDTLNRQCNPDRLERPSVSDGRDTLNRQCNTDGRNRLGNSHRRVNPDRNSSLERRSSFDRHGSLHLRGRHMNTDRRESRFDGRDTLNRQCSTDGRNRLGNSHRRDDPDRNSSLERRSSSDRRGLRFSCGHNYTDRREHHGSSDVNDNLHKEINPQRRDRRRITDQDRNGIFERRGSCGRRDKSHLRGRHNSNDRLGSDRRDTCSSSVRRTILPRHSSSDSLRSLDRNGRPYKRERRGSSDTRVSLERRHRYNRPDRRDRRSRSVSRASLHPTGRYSSPDKREKHGTTRRFSPERQRHIRSDRHDRLYSTDRRDSLHLRSIHSSPDKSERRGRSNTRVSLDRLDERYLDEYDRCSTRNRFPGTANESTKESARKQRHRERFPGTTQPPRRNRLVCYTNEGSDSSPRRRFSPPAEPCVSSKVAALPQECCRNREPSPGPRAIRDCDALRTRSSFNTYNLHETQRSSATGRVGNRGLESMSKCLFLNDRLHVDASAPLDCKFQELEQPTTEKSEDSLTRDRESPRSISRSFLDESRVNSQIKGEAVSGHGRLEPERDYGASGNKYSKEDDCKIFQSREPENGQSNNTLRDNHKMQVLESSCQTETPYQTYTTDEDLKRQIHNSETYQQDERLQCTQQTKLQNQPASGYAQIDSNEFSKPDYQHRRETLPSCQRNLCLNSGHTTSMTNVISYSHEEYYKNPEYNEAENRNLRARSFHYKHQYIEGSIGSNKSDKPLLNCPFHNLEKAHFYNVKTPEIRFSFCNTRNRFQNDGTHWRPYNTPRAHAFACTPPERDTLAPQRGILQDPRNHGRASELYGDPHSGVTTSEVNKFARETVTGLESVRPLMDSISQRCRAGGFHNFSSPLPRKFSRTEQSRSGRGSFTSCLQNYDRNHQYARRNPHSERHASEQSIGNFPSPTDRKSYDSRSKHEALPVFNSPSYRITNSFTERQRRPGHNSNTRCFFKPQGTRHTHVISRASRMIDPLPPNRITGVQKWPPTDENNRGLDRENILSDFRNSRKPPSYPSLTDPSPSNRITGRVQKWSPTDEYNRGSDHENALSNFRYSRKPSSYNYTSPVHGFERMKFYKWSSNESNQSLGGSKTYFEQNYTKSNPIIHSSIYESDMQLSDVNATLSHNGLRTVDACKRRDRDHPTLEMNKTNRHENGCRKMQMSKETQTTSRWCECNLTSHSADACDAAMKQNVETLKEERPHNQATKGLYSNQDPGAPFTHVAKRLLSKEILSTLSNPNFDLTFLRSWKEMLSGGETFSGLPNPNFKTPSYPNLQHRWSESRLAWNPDNIYSPSPLVTGEKHPRIPKSTGRLSRSTRSTNTDPSLHKYLDSACATVERFILQNHQREFDDDGELHCCSECDFETSELCVFKKHKCMHKRRRFYKKSLFADWATPGHNPL